MPLIIALTKPTIDIFTPGLSLDDFTYHSNFDTLKYHVSGQVTVNVPTTGSSSPNVFEEEVVHGLGYVPFFIAFVDRFALAAGRYHLCPGQVAGFQFPDIEIGLEASAYADEDKIYFQVSSQNSATGDFDFRYKIFRNDLGI